MKIFNHFIFAILTLLLLCNCEPEDERPPKDPPEDLPYGILIDELPAAADVIFASIRYVLNTLPCLDEDYYLKDNFIHDADCNPAIYAPGGAGLAIPRQLYCFDIETKEATQITNTEFAYFGAQAIDNTTLMVHAAIADDNGDGYINENDESELYLLDLPTEAMTCLTCDYEFNAINNPDYSAISGKIVFSAQKDGVFHNYLYTIDEQKNLTQLTNDNNFMDFDCAWSEDASLIVFNRLPMPLFSVPSQIWLMNANGTNLIKYTDGGDNPNNETDQRGFPIGTDADPDLSPDNSQIVFSRLKTGLENGLFGVWELVTIDVTTGTETILDDSYANMIPEWKDGGIIFVRQTGGSTAMDFKQGLWLYANGSYTEIEDFPYHVFPIGANSCSWIEY